MTTYHTRNSLGSTAVKDLFDNAENLDHRENDLENEAWADRLGVPRLTWYGIEKRHERQQQQFDDQFQQFLLNSGYEDLGGYGPGIEIATRNQVFRYNGELYRASADLDLPYITTGVWANEKDKFVAVGDGALRQELTQGPGGEIVAFRQNGSGAVLTNLQKKAREWVSPEDFGAIGNGQSHPLSDFYETLEAAQSDYPHAQSLSDEIDTVSWQAAINSGARQIRGRPGAVYLVRGLTVGRALRFVGSFTFKKKLDGAGLPTGSIIDIRTGLYQVAWADVTFDGSWSNGYSDPDIVFTHSSNGLRLLFERCSFDYWSKYSLDTGYPGVYKIHSIKLQTCATNGIGAYKQQAQSETAASIIAVNYAGRLDIIDCDFPGDGVYDLGDGTAAGLVRAPAFAILCTYTRVTVKDSQFIGSSGVVLYTGCDNSQIENCYFEDCLHAISAQECILPIIRNCRFIRSKAQYRGTVTIQPYARLTSSVGRKVEGLIGAIIENCMFEGNEIDISALGVWLYAGQYGVQNTRCRGVRVRKCISKSSTQRFFVGQDVDDIEFQDVQIYSPCQSTTTTNAGKVYLLTSTATNGHGSILIDGGIVSSEGGNADQIVQSINMTAISTTMRLRARKMKISGFDGSTAPLVYARYANVVQFSDNDFSYTTQPAVPFKALDNREVEILNNLGLTYPANGMEVTDTTIQVLRSDHRQTGRLSRFFSTSTPANSNFAVGSVADVPSPVPGGPPSRTYTQSGGWKNTSTLAT